MVNLINYKFKYVNIFRTRIAFSLFILSFSTGLFSLTIFQTLSFLIIPVIYFFILLLFGMPIGSIISIKYFNDNRHDFQKSLYITEFSMISSLILFIIFIKIENFLFFGIDLSSNYILILKLIIRLFFGILFFLSFFISYGMTEFLGYQIGLTYLNQNSKLIYSLYLFGTASSYLFFRLLLDHVGISSLIFFSLIGIISANLLIKSKNNYLNYAKILILIIMLFNSKLENIYLDILESKESGFSTKYFSNLDSKNIFQGWSKYCHLSISEDNNLIYGFYNGLLAWIYPKNLKQFISSSSSHFFLDYNLLNSIPDSSSLDIAILGSGGGLQLKEALELQNPQKIVAVEIIPKVIEYFKNYYPGHVYQNPKVKVYSTDGRKYIQNTTQKFNLILLSSVDSHLTSLKAYFEPSQTLYTREAFQSIAHHLKEGGILAIIKITPFDPNLIFFKRSFKMLEDLGLNTYGFLNDNTSWPISQEINSNQIPIFSYMIIGQKGTFDFNLQNKLFENLSKYKYREINTNNLGLSSDIVDITDDKPFPIHAISIFITPKITYLFCSLIVFLTVIFMILINIIIRKKLIFRNTEFPKNIIKLSLISFMIGLNFILLEYLIIYLLLKYLSIPMDSAFWGTVLFLFFAGLGSILTNKKHVNIIFIVCLLSSIFFLVLINTNNNLILLLFSIPLIFLSGSFFPSIFFGHKSRLILIYSIDALGVIFGGLLSLIIPIFWGFKIFYFSGIVLFIISFLILNNFRKDAF
ncbi:MAG: hypothetical protein NT009_10570 [Proteobacteria bacterium]|nr:hypothetical protein [Pseudomonadota bacterium]